MIARDQARFCILTPSGRGAIAVVAVEGNAAVAAVARHFQAANLRELNDQPLGRIVYGHWGGRDGEDLVVCRRSESALEIHCHGGRQSSAQIAADLTDVGCTVIDAEQWLARQHACPVTAAAHAAMAQVTTLRTAAILLDQYHGALRREVEAIASHLVNGNAEEATASLEELLQYAELGRHLTEPWRVVIAGQPNVGKSSLINALVGYERAIVFDQPGTTRDVVSATTAIEGWPVELSDTAGLHETTDQIETAGIGLARERLATADLVVWVLDAAGMETSDRPSDWALAEQQAAAVGVQLDSERTQIVVNKIDLAPSTPKNCLGTCAVSGAGIEELLAVIAAHLVPNCPSPGVAMPFVATQVEALQAALAATRSEDLAAASEIIHSCSPRQSRGG